ncbi:protein SOB FIVE-LIKE 5-like [Malania oleifera]|uniref:protein SOB FIVE-LIKE 5-like n=1 Tax=Malania oleifera TaxID=397392 RepID=UPI0025ADF29D|nr:protein SOB FIVE-LIKE 5-like [Malania oleifera]
MDVQLASECGSGCESGWTLYLEQSFLSQNPSDRGHGFADSRGVFTEQNQERRAQFQDQDEEEDLSMVSDASSGPPHFPEDDAECCNDDNGCFYPASVTAAAPALANSGGKRQKTKERRRRDHQAQPSSLDDTASSPAYNFSMNNAALTNNQVSMESILDYSQGFSATHYEGRSTFQNQYFGFLQSGNQLQQNQWFDGKRWG